ncbi:uncharacterized protein BO87DRAFT_372620, partial [Aspergillus neoniger CBS 115656]
MEGGGGNEEDSSSHPLNLPNQTRPFSARTHVRDKVLNMQSLQPPTPRHLRSGSRPEKEGKAADDDDGGGWALGLSGTRKRGGKDTARKTKRKAYL